MTEFLCTRLCYDFSKHSAMFSEYKVDEISTKNVLLRNKCTRPSLKTLNSACVAQAKNSQHLPSAVAHLKNEKRSINCQAAEPQLSRFCLPTTQFSDHYSHAEILLNYSKVHRSHNLLFLPRRSIAVVGVNFLIISITTATSQQFLNIKISRK